MSKELKEAVLAKCGELAPESGSQSPIDKQLTTVIRVNDRQVGDRANDWQIDTWRDGASLSLTISDEIDEGSYVWPLAAQILGIGDDQAKKDRELLWTSWKTHKIGVFNDVFGVFIEPENPLLLHESIRRIAGQEVQNG